MGKVNFIEHIITQNTRERTQESIDWRKSGMMRRGRGAKLASPPAAASSPRSFSLRTHTISLSCALLLCSAHFAHPPSEVPRLFALSPRHRLGSTKNGGASFDGTTPDVSGKGKGAAWFLRNERSGMDDLILTTSGLFVCKMCVCTFTLWVPRGKLKRRKQKRKQKWEREK